MARSPQKKTAETVINRSPRIICATYSQNAGTAPKLATSRATAQHKLLSSRSSSDGFKQRDLILTRGLLFTSSEDFLEIERPYFRPMRHAPPNSAATSAIRLRAAHQTDRLPTSNTNSRIQWQRPAGDETIHSAYCSFKSSRLVGNNPSGFETHHSVDNRSIS